MCSEPTSSVANQLVAKRLCSETTGYRLTIHNKPVILAILICEKYLMSNCLFLVGNNLFNHSSSVQRLFWRCLDVCNVYLFLVKSRGAEEPN